MNVCVGVRFILFEVQRLEGGLVGGPVGGPIVILLEPPPHCFLSFRIIHLHSFPEQPPRVFQQLELVIPQDFEQLELNTVTIMHFKIVFTFSYLKKKPTSDFPGIRLLVEQGRKVHLICKFSIQKDLENSFVF